MKKVNWGILSTGRIAHQFAQDFAFVEGATMLAASSRTYATAVEFGETYEIPRVYKTFAEMLADEDIDVVYIATPHSIHFGNVIDAIQAGKAVLCEKPLVTSVEDCESLIVKANLSSTYLMEAMWTWFLPAIQTAKRWVDQGRIGRLVQVKADFGYPQRPYSPDKREYDASLGGGAMLEMGVYPVALACLFAGSGELPESIHSSIRYAPNGVEDDFSAVLQYENHIATLGCSFRSKMQNWAYIIGEDGYIAIPDFWRANKCFLYELDTQVDQFTDERQSIGLCYETQAVIDDLNAGKIESNIMPLEHSLRFQQLMKAILLSAQERVSMTSSVENR